MTDHDSDTVPHSGEDPFPQAGGQPGKRMGPYVLRERVGVGGMGEVWRAEQSEPIRRTVAIKLIKAGMDTADVLARFEAERQALALMDHPCIAKVFDAGTTPEGRPYFVMEYVQGSPIDDYCDRRRLNTRERLELFQKVCQGVQHAHQKAVLHRDLKPSNILVADVDGLPTPKIIDFGVAKATSRKLTDTTMYTSIGQLIGTPEYMSPEQAEPTSEDVDTRTDVYSLGVILYELLVGCLPFDSKQLRKAGLDQVMRVLREQDPPRPSTRLLTEPDLATASAVSRRTQPKRLSSEVRGDLDWIVLRAMEKDRNRRYGSPAELAQDLERHLRNEVVLAGPPTVRYRTSKFVRRHRTGVTVAGATALALLVFAVVTGYQARTIAQERDRAEAEARKASAMNDFLTGMLAEADPWMGSGKEVTVAAALDAAATELDRSFEGPPEVEASLRATLGQTYLGLGMPGPAEVQLDRAIEIQTGLTGTDSREVAILRATQAKLSQDRADYAAAVQRAAEAARIFRADRTSTPRDLLNAYQHQARNLLFSQDYAAAESVLALCDELGTLPAMQKNVISAENFSLRADLLAERDGNNAAAESLSRKAYERARSTDPNAGTVAIYMNNTAQYHSRSGDLEGALTDFDSLVVVTERIFGRDHPEYATVVENRGGVLYRLGRPAETFEALEEVLDIRRRNLGPDHIDVLRTTINTATVASLAGDSEKAVRIFRELLPRLVEVRGTEHPDVLAVYRNLGGALNRLERFDEARQTFETGLDIAQRMYEDDDPRVATLRSDLGVTFARLGRFSRARELLVTAFDVNLEKLGPEHPKTRDNATWLVKVCAELGRDDEVRRYRSFVRS